MGCCNERERTRKQTIWCQFLWAVCCKDQLKSCNIEKIDVPKLCQNKGLGELILKICFRSFRFQFIFGIFCILHSQQPKLTSKSGFFRKLPFKKWKCCRKDQPRKSKDLISSTYWRWKIWKGVEPEFLTLFDASWQRSPTLKLDEIQGSKKHSDTWLHPARLHSGKEQSFQLHVWRKKNWSKLNGEFWQYFQNCRSLEQYEWPFDLWCHSENPHTTAFNLTFIRRDTRFFTFVCFADLFEGRRD